MPPGDKTIYLTFDDGPNSLATPFVLDTLRAFDACATFFCIGKNVREQHEIYKRIIDEGHKVGNHTFNHLNGWKTKDADYLDDIMQAKSYIDSDLFRPPYGKITGFQAKQLSAPAFGLKVVMWSVLSGDFDSKISKEKCLENVLLNTTDGNIVVFHDSQKAFEKLQYVLPLTLKHFSEKGFRFKALSH
jgi:peptidoglycan/xylan/chitin deacetylase (PgdA/CDA1 family)